MIKAFTYQLKDIIEKETVTRLLALVFEQDIEIFNIPQFSPDKNMVAGDAVISFGKTAQLAVDNAIESKQLAVTHMTVPNPKRLVNKEGNEETRDVAWNTLQILKGKINQSIYEPGAIVITEKDMPELDKLHMLALQKLISKSNSKFCIKAAKNGKTIAIGDSIPTDLKADIKISFEELYTVRNVMDILGIDSVSLVNLE
jgi:hypothetical protein